MATLDLLERGYQLNPMGDFLIMDESTMSYTQARDKVHQIANALIQHGYRAGDIAAVLSPNDPVAFLCSLAIQAAGLTYLPLNPYNSIDVNSSILDKLDCSLLLFQSGLAKVVDDLRQDFPRDMNYVCIDADQDADLSLAGWLSDATTNRPQVWPRLDAPCFFGQTGGTTGEPKGVVISNRAITDFVQKSLIEQPSRGTPVYLAMTPMTHAAGILAYPIMAQGGTVIIMSKPDPGVFLHHLNNSGVTMTFVPPTILYGLLDIPGIRERDYSNLEYFLIGAAPVSTSKLREAIDVFGPVMCQGYGQTECHTLITLMRPGDLFAGGVPGDGELLEHRLASCGRPTIGNTILVLGDDGEILQTGELGEICVNSDLAMDGYYKDEQATTEAFVDGLIRTGDVGHVDEDGFLYLSDRKKDLIISGGFNIYPAEVEQALLSHPDVVECAVIGVPDKKWGEAAKAVVQLSGGASMSAESLIKLCKKLLGSVKAPKTIDFVETLPRSAVGKVLKNEIREKYWGNQKRNI